ncbi:FAD-binding oxidoreductase [Alisedimentitalea sp. MJ-SS2]|uniref:FAD-binding oxidoreductase n=1 Tax=Aliisedimentitalea sp. MJ-SS2 TaxID=3049795 RepID=UPI002908A611|nr:FAD-binding oxidoreductase [Alisedimentitalea sp. MJ-SS2]MDU8926098.1 FAD-binding oxidoreductase [Alisedimentitalea sp. MJ-SS2]
MRWKSDTYSGWGRALKADGDLARPERISALKGLPPTPAFGARRSYGDACLNSDGRAIDMTRLDRILSFDPETGLVEAEAGISIGELVRLFAPAGWIPTVMPGTGFATVGGAIAMDVHGKNHHRDGAFGDHITAIRLIHQGKAKTITPDRNKSLFNATRGGLGQTGLIVSATIQMAPISGQAMKVRESRAGDLEEHLALLDASDAHYTVGWIDATARGSELGRGIVEEAEHSLDTPPKLGRAKSVPVDAPRFALSKPVVKAFNTRYFKRIPEEGRTRTRTLQDFFFPLDRVLDWNRLYGKRGFHQFQCVLPMDQTDTLHSMIEAIAGSGLASPLAVLKRLGPEGAGFLSFPTEGYTLAVDFPNRDKAQGLIRDLGEQTAAADGRIYLAKDSLADGATIRAMYPELGKWQAEAAKADPDRQLETDLIRRLNLRSA